MVKNNQSSFDGNSNFFADQIRKRRLAKGWDQIQLARSMGVNPTTVSRWENGKNVPTKSSHVKALKRELNFSDQDFREAFGVQPSSDEAITRFDRFDAAASNMRSKISELIETEMPIDIKWIGMTMEYGAPVIVDVASELERYNYLERFSIEIAMIDPEWRGVRKINPSWSTQISAHASRLFDSLPKNQSKIFFYSEAPGVHGFMINNKHLYESFCSWRKLGSKSRLFGGENPYEYFDIQQKGEPQWRGENFLGWFDYFKQRASEGGK
tara:strand:+ start:404 stop:1207 length:804 start_codon:yes stop_codon:yes gene_type:complete